MKTAVYQTLQTKVKLKGALLGHEGTKVYPVQKSKDHLLSILKFTKAWVKWVGNIFICKHAGTGPPTMT